MSSKADDEADNTRMNMISYQHVTTCINDVLRAKHGRKKKALANSVDPDETPHGAASHQDSFEFTSANPGLMPDLASCTLDELVFSVSKCKWYDIDCFLAPLAGGQRGLSHGPVSVVGACVRPIIKLNRYIDHDSQMTPIDF
ncbi:hypothetical protein DPMN_072484 [Dreissena polymorpha]|uniref:Uncharacterized protein n=1 Tax=Dreissena polymorpha TaxID=45954 RepID=A0A9D4BWU1_DREPO|nr:hypothetical protein DPMN_072484 [Dreissena polymorpha]